MLHLDEKDEATVGATNSATTQGPSVDAIAAFRAHVLAEPALQHRLAEFEDRDAYIAAALALSDECGITLSRDAIGAATQPDVIGVGRWMAAPVTLDRWPGHGWLPTRSAPNGAEPAFDWAWFGTHRLVEPFFESSVRRIASRPFNAMFLTRTSLATLLAGAEEDEDIVPPTGFIFHMSRCGSTLATQMFSAVPENIVVSEAEPIDAVVQWAMSSGAPIATQTAALRAVVAALGRKRSGNEGRMFVKLDSWHTLALPLFRAAFPGVPWVFLHRAPVEVLVSHSWMPAAQVLPGALQFSAFQTDAVATLDPTEYAARALAAICTCAADHAAAWDGLVVNYSHVAEAMLLRIPQHFGFTPDTTDADLMRAAAGRDAKAPEQSFVSDSASKRAAAPPGLVAISNEILGPVHARLVALERQ